MVVNMAILDKDISLYFQTSPNDRVNLRLVTAKQIQSFADILKVLDLANSLKIKEQFDSSIALLAECKSSILVEAIQKILNLFDHLPEEAQKYEGYWVIVILALACCQNYLSTYEKMKALTSLCAVQSKLTREVKTAIIDAISLLDGVVNPKILLIQLNYFTGQNELDQYVRNYAKEVIENLDSLPSV